MFLLKLLVLVAPLHQSMRKFQLGRRLRNRWELGALLQSWLEHLKSIFNLISLRGAPPIDKDHESRPDCDTRLEVKVSAEARRISYKLMSQYILAIDT